MEFSKRFKEIRQDKNLTQMQLALEMGVTDSTIRGWEKNREPSYELLCKLAEKLYVTVGQLLGTEDY